VRGRTHHVYLIPGFFGFVNFGRLAYFDHVREILEQTLGQRGIIVEFHRARISPTASIRRRAAELLEYVAETAPPDGVPIHIIAHSTGGLDARMFLSPGVDLGTELPLEAYARRVKTLVTLSTPHHGAPLARLFTSILGQKVLALLSVATVEVLRTGRVPLSIVARLGAALAGILRGGTVEAVLDHLSAELLGRLPDDERDHLSSFLQQIGKDQSLLPQLMPEGIDVFNAGTPDRPGVRYGCVVARAAPPSLRAHFRFRARLYAHATYEIYRLLHFYAGLQKAWIPRLTPEQELALETVFGEVPAPGDSDGIVPTLSQVRGDVIHAAEADHHDVIGHFHDERHVPPHHDWVSSGSRFDRHAFELLWGDVTRFLVGA
jgi:hypothetical protein